MRGGLPPEPAIGGIPIRRGIFAAAIISLIGVPAQAQQSQNSALLKRGRDLVEDGSAGGLCQHPEVPTGERSRAKRCPAGG